MNGGLDKVTNHRAAFLLKYTHLSTDKHNELRSRIALGQESGQPAAADMNKLVKLIFRIFGGVYELRRPCHLTQMYLFCSDIMPLSVQDTFIQTYVWPRQIR